jgi:hypothetical protein
VNDHPDLKEEGLQLDALLGEMGASVLGEQSRPVVDGRRPTAPMVFSRLIIHDRVADWHLAVEIRAAVDLVSVLAAKLLGLPDPAPDDVLDVIAELGNIAAGNVKTLLCTNGRLSLPVSALLTSPATDVNGSVRADAEVLGQVLELAVMPLTRTDSTISGARWPGSPAITDAQLVNRG